MNLMLHESNEFFDDDAISKSTIQVNNSFDKEQLDEQIERPFTPEIPKEQCPHCKRQFFQGRLTPHLRSCTADHPFLKKPKKLPTKNQKAPARPLKALDKYRVVASINEEEEADETILLSSSQPSFLPKIKLRHDNVLSRSVPIVKCPTCLKTFEQKVADKHMQVCARMNSGNKLQRSLFCTNCGSKFANNHKYCGSCGKKRL